MLHRNLVDEDIHTLARWTVADTAARTALTPALDDVGKVVYQEDEEAFYILAKHSPVKWLSIGTTAAGRLQHIIVACSAETKSISTGVAKVSFAWPVDATLVAAHAFVSVAQTTGSSLVTVDVNVNGASILSTKITIDNTEYDSRNATIPAVLSAASLAEGDIVSIDIDACDTATIAKGLKVHLSYIPE